MKRSLRRGVVLAAVVAAVVAGVLLAPGIGYGPSGEGYIRLSLTIPDERLEEGVRRLEGLRG